LIKIAVDAMGGDHAPHDVVRGAIEAARQSKGRFEIVLVGDEPTVQSEISHHFHVDDLPLSIIAAKESVDMDELPSVSLKKKDSSIAVMMNMHRDHKVDAVVSAGNTGAVMASALFTLKRIEGVRRPAIGSFLPTEEGQVLLLDVGSNLDSRPQDLLEFGTMGSICFRLLYNNKSPRVGLLSVGQEAVKGNELTLRTHALLEKSKLNFIGNVEGGDILHGVADVVVCDGFIGNVVLKFAESLHGLFKSNLRRLVRKYFFSQIGAFLMQPTFEGIRKVFDYQEYGGAPLLGVQGVVIIGHGKSSPRAIKNAILAAHKMVDARINKHIQDELVALRMMTRAV